MSEKGKMFMCVCGGMRMWSEAVYMYIVKTQCWCEEGEGGS